MRVLVIGSGGFVGTEVVRALARRRNVEVRASTSSLPPGTEVGGQVGLDLTLEESVRAACEGADAVISAAHLISGEPEQLEAVNARGGILLARAARDAGVGRVVRLGTAAVYGSRLGSLDGDLVTIAPTSPTSATRAEGDDAVLAEGGVVVRPHLVHGEGDRWVVPRLLEVTARVGWIDEGRARHSAVSASALASALVDLLDPAHPSGVWLAEEEVVSVRELYTRYAPAGTAGPTTSVTRDDATEAAPPGDRRWIHDVAFLSRDTVLDTSGLTRRSTVGGAVSVWGVSSDKR